MVKIFAESLCHLFPLLSSKNAVNCHISFLFPASERRKVVAEEKVRLMEQGLARRIENDDGDGDDDDEEKNTRTIPSHLPR